MSCHTYNSIIYTFKVPILIIPYYFRNRSAKHYRHRASPDCNTVASFDSSSSESHNGGLNRYYRQAWENLHESAGSKTGLKAAANNHSPLRRKETLDEPYRTERHRDGSDMAISEAHNCKGGVEKKRHHHHHHHHESRTHKEPKEWRDQRPPPHREHKRY